MKLDTAPSFYRANVGLMLIGPDRRVFIGQRLNKPGAWQMPQGGIDKGERAIEAACRELGEEVGTTKALLLRESRDWITYDVPKAVRPSHWRGRWRGQAQKWFALAFTGQEDDIDLTAHHPEFSAWRWATASELSGLIVDWKRPAYTAVLAEFADLIS
jgi:putative (di)nucleoside polyphosphate hydrolase